MSTSPRLRFELFKRDGFRCVYCGRTPPNVTLEIDHLHPRSRGGKNDPNNLVTACFDCNRGKRDIPLNKIPRKLSDHLEILKERERQLREYRRYTRQIQSREEKDAADISKIFSKAFPESELTDRFKNGSVKQFLRCLPKHEVEDAMWIAVDKCPYSENRAIKYFCGICWNKIKAKGQSLPA